MQLKVWVGFRVRLLKLEYSPKMHIPELLANYNQAVWNSARGLKGYGFKPYYAYTKFDVEELLYMLTQEGLLRVGWKGLN